MTGSDASGRDAPRAVAANETTAPAGESDGDAAAASPAEESHSSSDSVLREKIVEHLFCG